MQRNDRARLGWKYAIKFWQLTNTQPNPLAIPSFAQRPQLRRECFQPCKRAKDQEQTNDKCSRYCNCGTVIVLANARGAKGFRCACIATAKTVSSTADIAQGKSRTCDVTPRARYAWE